MLYDEKFYSEISVESFKSANVIVPYLINRYNPSSVVDFGCGFGAWLLPFALSGIKVLGVDYHDFIYESYIPKSAYFKADLRYFVDVGRFDIALCLEVAEHISAEAAPILVKSLTNASDIIVFSAAIPGQGGHNHINEQRPEYWQKLFYEYGYGPVDIRGEFWNNKDVGVCYRQNIIIYKRGEPSANLAWGVHPNLFEERSNPLNVNLLDVLKLKLRRLKNGME